MTINNCYLGFIQRLGLILLVNDNHMENYYKEILVYVYFGWIVNNQLKNLQMYLYVRIQGMVV